MSSTKHNIKPTSINPSFTTPPLKSTPLYTARPFSYGPKPKPGFTSREFLYPNKSNVYDGVIMTSGILLASFLVKLVKKDMAPQFTSKSTASLALVTILSDYLIDLGKRYQYIPYSI